MNPTDLIPAVDVFTAPAGWFQLFLVLTFPLHLLAMNGLVGGSVAALVARLRTGPAHQRLARHLARVLPFLVAFTVNLGVAPLLFVNVLYGQFLYPSAVLLGFVWLAVVPLLIIAYYGYYLHDARLQRPVGGGVTTLVTSLALVLAMGFVLTHVSTLLITPAAWTRWFTSPGGGVLDTGDASLLPRYLHFIVGGVAVGGMLVALYSKVGLAGDPEASEAGQRLGMHLFGSCTVLTAVLGGWFLLVLPEPASARFMGGSGHATGLMGLGVVLALATMHLGFRRNVYGAAGLTLPLLYIMSFMRDDVRRTLLAPFFDRSTVPVTPEWSPLILFVVTLVLGIATVAWMLLQVARMRPAPPPVESD